MGDPKWIIDVSVWQNMTTPYFLNLKVHGLAGVIIRCAQGMNRDNRLLSNVKAAKEAGIPFGVYQWVDPTLEPIEQAKFGIALKEQTGALFLAGDFEQYWQSWEEWNALYNRHEPITLTIVPPQHIYDVYAAYSIVALTKDRNFVGYSAPWFVNGWCPQLYNLLKQLPFYWNASYITWKDPSGDNWVSWNEHSNWLKTLPPERKLKDITTSIWQVLYLTIEGTMSIDQNVIYSQAVYDILFGGVTSDSGVVYIPEIPKPVALTHGVVMAVLNLRVRKGPGTQYDPPIRSLPFLTKIDIYEIKSGWAKISPDKEEWVSMAWVKEE